MLKRQAEFEEDLEYEDSFDFDKIEVKSSINSIIDDVLLTDEPRRISSLEKTILMYGENETSSRDILKGITKQVIRSQMSINKTLHDIENGEKNSIDRIDISNNIFLLDSDNNHKKKSSLKISYEKEHFIDRNTFYKQRIQHPFNLKISSLNENKKHRMIEFNKLLECLSILIINLMIFRSG